MTLPSQTVALIGLMADGEFHSGESLGKQLGISRAAVWKLLNGVAELGIDIHRTRGLGYRIKGGLSLLARSQIEGFSRLEGAPLFDDIVVLSATDSTNRYLLEKIAAREHSATHCVCLAEMQTAGRGRRGRVWQSPFARNIYLSLSWQFESGVLAMEGLSLAVGVAVAEALAELGCDGVALKWPNDLLVDNAKLGGVLVEIVGDASGQCHAVVGIGLNVSAPPEAMAAVDQPWVDLRAVVGSGLPGRSQIAGVLIRHVGQLLRHYEAQSFARYRERWEARNAYRDKKVTLATPSHSVQGTMLGVSDAGALRLCVEGEEKHYVGGELSLRLSP